MGDGAEPANDFAITSFEATRDPEGKPAGAASVRNIGGRAIDLSGELRPTNSPGGLSAGPFDCRAPRCREQDAANRVPGPSAGTPQRSTHAASARAVPDDT